MPPAQQLRWQCRRGMLELDYGLERYLGDHDDAERSRFRQLLTAQDAQLQVWLLNGVTHPDPAYRLLISRLRSI